MSDKIYVMYLGVDEISERKAYKIGYSWSAPLRREEFAASNPNVKIIISLAVKDAPKVEKHLHGKYKLSKLYGEIFLLTDAEIKSIYKYLLRIATKYERCSHCGYAASW